MQKRTFTEKQLSDLRHDLKNPLAVIQGYSELINSKLQKDSKEEKWMNDVLKELQRLLQMVDQRIR